MNKTITKQEQLVIRWYWKKASYEYICKQTGISVSTISNILKRHGIGRSFNNVRDNTYYKRDVYSSKYGHYDGLLRYKYSGEVLSTSFDKDGYVQVQIDGTSKRAHRIIAELYIPNPDNLPQVNHINGIKTDNRTCNLEWVTASKNELHSYRILGKKNYSPNKGRTGVVVIGSIPRMDTRTQKVYGNLRDFSRINNVTIKRAYTLFKKKILINLTKDEYEKYKNT